MKIYLIGGKARNGKDTFGKMFRDHYQLLGKKVCVMHLSNYIKHFAIDYFDWDGKDDTKPRSLLQQLGTDIIREKMNKKYFFVNRLLEDMEVLDNFFDVCLVTDIRFPLEYDEIKKVHPDATKILITRPDYITELTEKQKKHVTETALDNYTDYDYKVINRNLTDLKLDADKIIEMEEQKNEVHDS